MSSVSKTLDTGVTNNLEPRVFERKHGQPASFTARYNVNCLVYFEKFANIDPGEGGQEYDGGRKIELVISSTRIGCDLSSQ
jgi:hypothetical protein